MTGLIDRIRERKGICAIAWIWVVAIFFAYLMQFGAIFELLWQRMVQFVS